jgi:RNA polymerase sigma-70 factor, ECF subfamily
MTDEGQLLEAARAGDEKAFALLLGPYQAQLRTHCYRMLGSVHDAEDALQETMLRAWSGLARFESRSSLRSWLYRIATNASLRLIEKRPKRVLPIDYGPAADPHVAFGEPLTESIWLEPYPDAQLGVEASMLGPDARYEQRESIELAFAAAFQHLPPRQRAVLILRDVLGFSARETAETLEMTPVSVDSALQRAHKSIEQHVPAQTQQATLRALGDRELRQLVNRFADAWERKDVDAVVAMLADDARMTMPPWSSWYRGRDAIATFLRSWPLSLRKRWQLLRTGANGQPAVAGYLWNEQTTAFRPETIIVLTFQAARIEEITAFRSPELFPRFGLPDELPNDLGATPAPAPTPAGHHVSFASPRSGAPGAGRGGHPGG